MMNAIVSVTLFHLDVVSLRLRNPLIRTRAHGPSTLATAYRADLVVAGLVGLSFATAVGTQIFLRVVDVHGLRDLDDLFAQAPRLFHVAVVFDTLMAKL